MAKTKIVIDSEKVKGYGKNAGAEIVGIASSKDFGSSLEGYKPTDAMDGCVSVIVLGILSSKEAFTTNSEIYTQHRAANIEKTYNVAKAVEKQLKADGYKAKAVSGFSGKFIDGKHYGPISMKHAAELAGIGTIGRNMLLISPEYGTLLWFSAVLTDADLTPDKKIEFNVCNECNICVDACPINALEDPSSLHKIECGRRMFKMVNKKWEVDCFECRRVCPYCFGMNDK